jgi:succinoglycan biosynthesis transport protein ExoP
MNLTQFLLVLRARYRIVLIIFSVIVLGTLIVNLVLPKKYTATTSLVLNYKGVDPVTGLTLPAQLMPGYMATQVDIITSHNVAARVVDELKIAQNAAAQQQFNDDGGKGNIRDWFADLLLKNLEAKPSRESSVIEISFSSADPDFAATIANAFATAYQQLTLQLKVDPSQIAADFLNAQTKIKRDNLEQAQAKLSKFEQEKGLTSGIQGLDVENAKLNELSAQLVIAQAQEIDAASKQHGTLVNPAESPDVAFSPVVQGLRVDIARSESKLAELSQRLDKNHPQYQAAQAELDKLKTQLQDEIRNTTATIGGSANNQHQRVEDLRAQVAKQKARVLELNQSRDQLTVLQRDVDSAQHALEAVNQRFNQTNLEGQTNQTDIAVLNTAIAPLRPSSPRVFLNVLLSVFLGGLLGVGAGLLAEAMDRRVRSREDISESFDIPVFAVIRNKPAVSWRPVVLAYMKRKFPALLKHMQPSV